MTEVTKNVIEVAKNVCRTKNVTVYPSISQNIAEYRSISQYIAVYRIISHFLAVIDPNSFGLVSWNSKKFSRTITTARNKPFLRPRQRSLAIKIPNVNFEFCIISKHYLATSVFLWSVLNTLMYLLNVWPHCLISTTTLLRENPLCIGRLTGPMRKYIRQYIRPCALKLTFFLLPLVS